MICCFKKGKRKRKIYEKKKRVDSEMSKAIFPLRNGRVLARRESKKDLSNGGDPEKTYDSFRKHEVGENTERSLIYTGKKKERYAFVI